MMKRMRPAKGRVAAGGSERSGEPPLAMFSSGVQTVDGKGSQ